MKAMRGSIYSLLYCFICSSITSAFRAKILIGQSKRSFTPRPGPYGRDSTASSSSRSSSSSSSSNSNNNKVDADEETLAKHHTIVKSLHHAVHKRPRHNRAVEQAAQRMEQHLATTGLLPQPREWTLYIAAWGAAGQPDKALEVLSCAENEMARGSDEEGAINPKAIYGAAVSACCQSERLVEALQLLDRMRTIGYPPDVARMGRIPHSALFYSVQITHGGTNQSCRCSCIAVVPSRYPFEEFIACAPLPSRSVRAAVGP